MGAQLPDFSVGAQTEPLQKVTDLEQENARLRQELDDRTRALTEAMEQQTATSEVLKVISRSAFNLQVVLDALIEIAARLCAAPHGGISRFDGEAYRLWSAYGSSPELLAFQKGTPNRLERGSAVGRAALERRTVHILDVVADPEYQYGAKRLGIRTILAVPVLREDVPIGVIFIWRGEVRPFTERQIALLETFADQAVIAIENARLFEELERRNTEFREALEQQTATAEILRAIASSPSDLQAVLDAVVINTTRLCGADDASIHRVDDGLVRVIATTIAGFVPGEVAMPFGRGSATAHAIMDRRTIHTHEPEAEHRVRFPDSRLFDFGHQVQVITPLLREGEPIGTLTVYRRERIPFTDEQIRLLESFADQAVIAIENARLFDELADLNRTLEARVGQQVDQLERVGRLRRYLSPQLADLIVSSGDESILESHRRQITVVFCDLRGFTAFAETAEPEEVMGVLGEYHAAMGELIRQYDGTLDRFAGDGLMVFFNDPLPQPDHAQRAVRMACAMRERAAELAREWRRAGHELDFGVGIAVGYATLGRIGFEGRYDYTAIGTVANLAARLCDEAGGGQILISGRLHGMIERLIEAEPIGELALKGFHRPMAAFNITAIGDGASTEAGVTT